MNFVRVVRMAVRYRFTFGASIVSALAVAVLWGGNMGAVYPFVEVGLMNQTPCELINHRIEKSQQIIAEKNAELETLRGELAAAPDGDQGKIQTSIALAEDRVWAEQWALSVYEFLKPYIDNYLPTSPFQVFALVMLLLLVGTIVKDVFLVANNVLVARLAQQATFDLRKLFYRRTLRMDLATFSEDGTADLMSRFTNDMNQVASGLEVALRQADSRTAENDRLPGAGGHDLLAIADALADRRPVGRLSRSVGWPRC